jgi:hypothetical protein
MDIVVFIVERRNRVLLMKSNGLWVLPGGMVCSENSETRCLDEKVYQSVGKRIKTVFKKMEKVFSGISPTLSCEIKASVFVGELDLEGCELPQNKRQNVGWFSRENIPILNLSDVARQALGYYFCSS